MPGDLELAFRMVDAADAVTSAAWRSSGVPASVKADGSPVTDADVAAETAMRRVLRRDAPADGFVGEELGHHPGSGSGGRRWIADGIDGTRFFASGAITWGTLLALEVDREIRVAVCSSPLQQRRWWAVRGGGAFTGNVDGSAARSIRVNTSVSLGPDHVAACRASKRSAPSNDERSHRSSLGGRATCPGATSVVSQKETSPHASGLPATSGTTPHRRSSSRKRAADSAITSAARGSTRVPPSTPTVAATTRSSKLSRQPERQ